VSDVTQARPACLSLEMPAAKKAHAIATHTSRIGPSQKSDASSGQSKATEKPMPMSKATANSGICAFVHFWYVGVFSSLQ